MSLISLGSILTSTAALLYRKDIVTKTPNLVVLDLGILHKSARVLFSVLFSVLFYVLFYILV